MLLAVFLLVLVVGSVAFHFLSPWYFTPLASNWGTIDLTILITFWVTGAVFVAVNLFMAYCVIKFRHKKDTKAHYEPENTKLEVGLTVLTAIGVAAMLAPGLFVWGQFIDPPEESWELEAVGQQWRWMYRLPGEDGELGTTEPRFVSQDNPFGINPNDERGQDDLLVHSNEVRIPVDKPVKFLLRSKDVLHNFAVAQFRVKMDLVPGLVSYMWLTPTKEGRYDVLCEELCGIGHFAMRGRVVVDSQQDFDEWRSGLTTFAETQAMPEPDPVAGKRLYATCASCHGADGSGNQQLNAPRITGLDRWYVTQQLENFKKGIRGSNEDDQYGQQMAPMMSVLPNQKAIRDVSAYVASLPHEQATTTIEQGDPEMGKRYYTTCAQCHGNEGQGRPALHAPRLTGQSDWYLVRQLFNFKHGIRGAHPDDWFGSQMQSMAKIFRDQESMFDVVAYINTMPAPDEPENQADNQVASVDINQER